MKTPVATEGTTELVASGFSFPTSLAFDAAGRLYVAESGLPFGGAPPGGRVWRVGAHARRRLVVDGLRPPVNGLAWHEDTLYVFEGGHPGRISRVGRSGERETILDGLPGPGNYHVNTGAFGPDGNLYFSQGAMTNSGIVGLDAFELGWLRRLPHAHDLPGYEVELAGVNVETENPLGEGRVRTGAFVPFGTETEPGQRIPASLPCTAAVMRCDPDGSSLELVAWGLRNAYGLGFLPDGRLLATDQGPDDRGSRPIGNAADLLYEVRDGAWYGWPDFVGGEPVTDRRFRPGRGGAPTFLLANHHRLPPPEQPLLRLPAHAAAVKFDAVDDRRLLVALFGDERPMTAPEGPRAGRAVAEVMLGERTLRALTGAPLERPIDVRLHGTAVYVLDFGRFEIGTAGIEAEPGSGKVWRLEP